MLCLLYKFTPEQIANMTPFQQIALANPNAREVKDTIKFETMAEYMQWVNTRK